MRTLDRCVTTSAFKWKSTCAVGAGPPLAVRTGYRLLPWSPDLVDDHAEVKYLSFRDELDAVVFPCLGELDELPAADAGNLRARRLRPRGDVAGALRPAGRAATRSRAARSRRFASQRSRANIQNIGVTPHHRGARRRRRAHRRVARRAAAGRRHAGRPRGDRRQRRRPCGSTAGWASAS